MASGVLGTARLEAHVDTVVYTVPQDVLSVCNLSVCHAGNETALVRIALSGADSPVEGEYIEYNACLPAKSSMERTGLVLEAGRRVIVRSCVAGVNVVAYGLEE